MSETGRSSGGLERLSWAQEAAGSSPAALTKSDDVVWLPREPSEEILKAMLDAWDTTKDYRTNLIAEYKAAIGAIHDRPRS